MMLRVKAREARAKSYVLKPLLSLFLLLSVTKQGPCWGHSSAFGHSEVDIWKILAKETEDSCSSRYSSS